MSSGRADAVLALLTRELVRRAASCLARQQIPLMVLKGALWQQTLYAPHEARPVLDADVLVPAASFDRARRALIQGGFIPAPGPHSEREQDFQAPDLPLPLDLHRRLFGAGRYALDERGLFARAQLDRELFGAAIWVPHPLDQLAHLLGHLAADHSPGGGMYREDFARLIERARLDPREAAAHLDRHGLARAARYALAELASPKSHHFADACHTALKFDPVGDALAAAARLIIHKTGRFSPWSAIAGHTLNQNLGRSLVATAQALEDRLSQALNVRG